MSQLWLPHFEPLDVPHERQVRHLQSLLDEEDRMEAVLRDPPQERINEPHSRDMAIYLAIDHYTWRMERKVGKMHRREPEGAIS